MRWLRHPPNISLVSGGGKRERERERVEDVGEGRVYMMFVLDVFDLPQPWRGCWDQRHVPLVGGLLNCAEGGEGRVMMLDNVR